MEILKNFGFDPVLLVAQIVNFLLIFFLLKRFLYKPVLSMLKKRKDAVAQGIKQAEEARLTLEKTLEEEKKILTKAQNEARIIIEDSKGQAIQVSKEIEENTKKQAEKILTEARAQIDQDSKAAEQRLSQKVSVLAADMLTKSLQGMLGEKEQKQITQKVVKTIKK